MFKHSWYINDDYFAYWLTVIVQWNEKNTLLDNEY